MNELSFEDSAAHAGSSLRTWHIHVALMAIVVAEVAAVMACEMPVDASPEAGVQPWSELQTSLDDPPQWFQPAF